MREDLRNWDIIKFILGHERGGVTILLKVGIPVMIVDMIVRKLVSQRPVEINNCCCSICKTNSCLSGICTDCKWKELRALIERS